MTTGQRYGDKKIKLWTRQHQGVLKELREKGIYRVKKEYIQQKNDDISDYYFQLYDWYVKHAEQIVNRPDQAAYPIWSSTSSEMMLQPVEGTVVLVLEVEKRYVVLNDFEKWGYVVNYWYVPLDREDEKKHEQELKRYGIKDESALYMGHLGNFYPHLRKKIIDSWKRIFEVGADSDCLTQATLWEIRQEWVVDIISK